MNRHTRGPWKDESMLFSAGWRCVVNLPGGRSIDIADPQNRKTDDEDKANAVLIASAPDLLVERDSLKLQNEALRKTLAEIRDGTSEKFAHSKAVEILSTIEKRNHPHRFNTIESNPKNCLDCGERVY